MSYKCAISVFYLVLIILVLSVVRSETDEETGSLRPMCGGTLWWVPSILKQSPFISLLNNAYCPSWTTRHFITKMRQNTHLSLPRGLPLAVLCGGCYRSTKVTSNVTIRQEGVSMYQPAQVPIKSSDDEFVHFERGLACKVQYAITEALQRSGEIICTVQAGSRTVQEPVTYTVYDVPITYNEEKLDVPSDTVMLTCPRHPDQRTDDNPLIHVWYYTRAESPRIAAPTTNPHVRFKLGRLPLEVSCASYRLLRATEAVVTSFTVRKSVSRPQTSGATASGTPSWDNSGSFGAYGEVDDGGDMAQSVGTATVQLPMFIVAILSATGAILSVLLIIGACKLLNRRQRSHTNLVC